MRENERDRERVIFTIMMNVLFGNIYNIYRRDKFL